MARRSGLSKQGVQECGQLHGTSPLGDVIALELVDLPAARREALPRGMAKLGVVISGNDDLWILILVEKEDEGCGEFLGDRVPEGHRLGEGLPRLGNIGGRFPSEGEGASQGEEAGARLLRQGRPHGFIEAYKALPVVRDGGIQKNHPLQQLGDFLHDARGDHARVTVGHQRDVGESFEPNHIHDILDVGAERNLRAGEMGSFAESRQGGAVNDVTAVLQQLTDVLPIPTAAEGAVNDDDRGLLSFRGKGRSGSGGEQGERQEANPRVKSEPGEA